MKTPQLFLGVNKSIDARQHFIMLDQVPSISRSNSPLHCLYEARLVLQVKTQHFLRKAVRLASFPRGEFGKLRFLLRSEVYFHVFESR